MKKEMSREEKIESLKKKQCFVCGGEIYTLDIDTLLLRCLLKCKKCGYVVKRNTKNKGGDGDEKKWIFSEFFR